MDHVVLVGAEGPAPSAAVLQGRAPQGWENPVRRGAVTHGLLVLGIGWSLLLVDLVQRWIGVPGVAGWLADSGFVVVCFMAAFLPWGLGVVLRPLRMRRARGALYPDGAVVWAPDLLGLVTRGGVSTGVAWSAVRGYRARSDHVALLRQVGEPVCLPLHSEADRLAVFERLEAEGLSSVE